MPSVNSPLNTKTAFRRLPRTKPDVPSQGLITAITLRENPGSVNPVPLIFQIKLWPLDYRLHPNTSHIHPHMCG